MNEAQRQHYLKALGLTPWVARGPLPGAAVSPLLDWEDEEEQQAAPTSPAPAQEAPAPAPPPRLAPALGPAPPPAVRYRQQVEQLCAMGYLDSVAVLRAHASVSRVSVAACNRLANLCIEVQNRQLAAGADAVEAIVAAMQAHPQVEAVQDMGCWALTHVCSGSGAAARARRRRAVTARAPEAATAALQAHPENAAVQEEGQQLRDLLV